MSSDSCPTVKVQTPKTPENDSGYVVINESDLTAEHTLFSEDAPAAVVPAVVVVAPAVVTPVVAPAPALNVGTPPVAPWSK